MEKSNIELAQQAGMDTLTDENDPRYQFVERFAKLVEERQGSRNLAPASMVIDSQGSKFIHEISQADGDEDHPALRFMIGGGHSGHGLYVCLDEYPEEGAEVVCQFGEQVPRVQAAIQGDYIVLPRAMGEDFQGIFDSAVGVQPPGQCDPAGNLWKKLVARALWAKLVAQADFNAARRASKA